MRFRRESMACSLHEKGQSTVEYALVMVTFLSLLLGIGSLWRVVSGGLLVDHAIACASHSVMGVVSGVLADAFLV